MFKLEEHYLTMHLKFLMTTIHQRTLRFITNCFIMLIVIRLTTSPHICKNVSLPVSTNIMQQLQLGACVFKCVCTHVCVSVRRSGCGFLSRTSLGHHTLKQTSWLWQKIIETETREGREASGLERLQVSGCNGSRDGKPLLESGEWPLRHKGMAYMRIAHGFGISCTISKMALARLIY